MSGGVSGKALRSGETRRSDQQSIRVAWGGVHSWAQAVTNLGVILISQWIYWINIGNQKSGSKSSCSSYICNAGSRDHLRSKYAGGSSAAHTIIWRGPRSGLFCHITCSNCGRGAIKVRSIDFIERICSGGGSYRVVIGVEISLRVNPLCTKCTGCSILQTSYSFLSIGGSRRT